MGANANTGAASVRRTLLRQIAAEQTVHDDGARLGEIIESVAAEYRLDAALDGLADLHSDGEVYQPANDRIKLTTSPEESTLFDEDDEWDPEPAQLREGEPRDDDNTHTSVNERQVEMLTEDGDGDGQ